MMAKEPASLQLRYLQSMREIASERSTMTILPIPIDLVSPFIEMMKRNNARAEAADSATAAANGAAAPVTSSPAPQPLAAAPPESSLPPPAESTLAFNPFTIDARRPQ